MSKEYNGVMPLSALTADIVLNSLGYKTKWNEVDSENYEVLITAPAAIQEVDIAVSFLFSDPPKSKLDNGDLKDTDPMPFGKHKGTPMQDVPASYMFWLWTAAEHGAAKNHWSPVSKYIRKNLTAFEQEYPDGTWRAKL